MSKNLFQIAKQKKIKYFLISFVDLFGVLRSKLVPAHAIKEMQNAGAGFAGFAAWLDMTPADSDMFGIPDPDSLIQLPWNKEVGWLASDLWMNGKPVEASPRVMLKKQIKELAKRGLTMKSGVECEYFLISPNGETIADPRDTQSKPCYDQSALMRRYDVISEICDAMIELGWNPYQNDHEDANGQFEMNWDYTEALTTAGNTVTLDLSKDDHKITKSGTYTITCTGGSEASAHTLRIVNSGIATVGFSTYFIFPSGGTPSLPTASGSISLISFTVHRAGAVGVSTQLLSGASVNFS